MSRTRWRGGNFFVQVMVLGLLIGCGSANPVRKAERESTYRESLVSASRDEILREADQTLIIRYGFRFQETRTDSADDLRFVTSWKDVQPTDDELAQGYQGAQTRITLIGRPRNRLGGSSESFTVQFIGEVRLMEMNVWKRVPMTEQRRAYFKEIAEYLSRKLQTGF
ncbi:MAG: hypothetical protein KatS3mg042_1795 [Rhodothermaceae bacterium]|nr:MAG: hypothetical protein KatS3mg042_1795 [Rhodothermaceae bacterium]